MVAYARGSNPIHGKFSEIPRLSAISSSMANGAGSDRETGWSRRTCIFLSAVYQSMSRYKRSLLRIVISINPASFFLKLTRRLRANQRSLLPVIGCAGAMMVCLVTLEPSGRIIVIVSLSSNRPTYPLDRCCWDHRGLDTFAPTLPYPAALRFPRLIVGCR